MEFFWLLLLDQVYFDSMDSAIELLDRSRLERENEGAGHDRSYSGLIEVGRFVGWNLTFS